MESNLYRAHFIHDEDMDIMYLPDSLRFFKVNPVTKAVVSDICDGVEESEILNKYKITKELFNNISALLQERVEYNDTPENTLIKLTLNISNSCNLACKYCYANRGEYSHSHKNMDKETMKRAIDLFTSKFDIIQNVMFFGGEPTLNLDLLEYGCQYIYEKYENKEIMNCPNLGMVTNGTNVSQRLIDIINKYKMQVTVSLDGTKEVNDEMRVYTDGKGTFEHIVSNIKLLQEKCGQPKTIEATYSKVHIKKQKTVLDIVKYCKDVLHIPLVHVAPVSDIKGAKEYVLDDNKEFLSAIDEVFDYMDQGKDYVFTSLHLVMDGLKNKRIRTHYCEAGLSRFAVAVDGGVYPCYIFTDEEDTRLGSVYDDDILHSKKFTDYIAKLRAFNRFKQEKCKNCFYNTLCRQCVGENYFENNDLQQVSEYRCNQSREKLEVVIKNIVRHKKVN